jgi:hypothetical protein
MCAQARRRFTQVIHMVMHSKACTTFSCRAGRQRVSVPVLARGGRPAGRRSGLGHRPRRRAPDARRIPCRAGGPRPQAPACCHAHRDLAGGASSIRARGPGSAAAGAGPRPVPARPRAGAGSAGPHRRPGSAADHRPGNGRCRGAGPREASLLATARHPVMRARTPAGPARAWCRPGADRSGTSPRARLDPRSSRHFCGRRGAGPGKTFRPGRIRHGPSMYEMEGPCPASPPRLASCLVFAERRAPPAGARYPREGPVSRLLPRSRRRPRVVPVSSGESIITTAASTAQDPAAGHFLFSAIHGRLHREQAVIRIPRRLSTGFSQPIHRFPSVSRRTPQPPVPNARCYVTS